MDPIDLEEAYSVETKTQKQTFKLPEGPKNVEFFSRIGKSRLLRICQDNNLDEEILFTGWDGPSDSFVREQVSDHVQHYLFKRARRLSIDRKQNSSTKVQTSKYEKKFQDYENYIRQKNNRVDGCRADQEIYRVRSLLISGEIKTAPDGFNDIVNDPIYKANRLRENVKTLEKAEIKQNSFPFDLRNLNPIKNLNDSRIIVEKNKGIEILSSRNCIGDKVEHLPTPKSSLSDVESVSSGFEEITASPSKDMDITQSPFSNGGYFSTEAELGPHHPEGMDPFSVSSDDDELSCAEEHSVFEEITGDLEIDLSIMLNKSELSEPIEMILNQHTCKDLYKTGSEVVDMYLRQQVAGIEFMESFTSQYFGKQ